MQPVQIPVLAVCQPGEPFYVPETGVDLETGPVILQHVHRLHFRIRGEIEFMHFSVPALPDAQPDIPSE